MFVLVCSLIINEFRHLSFYTIYVSIFLLDYQSSYNFEEFFMHKGYQSIIYQICNKWISFFNFTFEISSVFLKHQSFQFYNSYIFSFMIFPILFMIRNKILSFFLRFFTYLHSFSWFMILSIRFLILMQLKSSLVII